MIRRLLRSLLPAVLCGALAMPSVALSQTRTTGQSPLSDAERTAIEDVVRDYILEHPEIIMEAVQRLQERQQAAEAERQSRELATRGAELFNDPADPVGGNPDGDVTVVEFFDYQCGYCKQVHPALNRLIADDDRVRVVYKEFPILGPASLTAAKAALASRAQGKYVAFHDALMAHRGPLDTDRILAIAEDVGLDTQKLKTDMDAPEVAEIITANLRLAEALNIRGTPAFVVGDQLVPGAIGLDALKELVDEARDG